MVKECSCYLIIISDNHWKKQKKKLTFISVNSSIINKKEKKNKAYFKIHKENKVKYQEKKKYISLGFKHFEISVKWQKHY